MRSTFAPAIICFLFSAFAALAADSAVKVVDARGKTEALDSVILQIADFRAVFVGETHDRYDEHLSELEIVRRLYEQDPKRWAVGVEFIQRPFQSFLDDYISGSISEKEFLKKAEYFDRWGFDFRLYRPIFSFAREHRIPMVALNVEEELVDEVAKSGLEGLPAAERSRLPQDYDKSDGKYRKRIQKVFKQHPEATNGNFEHFWEAQLTWDETMAQSAASYLRAHPDRSIVVLAGAGHIEFGSGLPNRVRRRLPQIKTAILIATDKPDRHAADYFLISKEETLPAAPKMGIVSEVADGAVRVKDVTKGGPAASSGVAPKDRILDIDGQAIRSTGDIRLALLDKKVGDNVSLRVQREGAGEMTFDVKLGQ